MNRLFICAAIAATLAAPVRAAAPGTALTSPAVPGASPPLPPAPTLSAALTSGRPLLNLRPRFEYVDQDNKSDAAAAFTLRTLVGWQTAPWQGFAAWLEFIGVTQIGSGDFNDDPRFSASARRPTVADPEDYDFNQAFIDYTGLPKTRLRVGRQSLKLDNVRFVGNVEFRQVMQVFDGFTVTNQALPNTEVMFAHFFGVKNIFSDYRNTAIELVHGTWKWQPSDTVTAYGYLQNQAVTGSNTGLADNSNRILGIRAEGQHPFGPAWKLLYTLEYAKQDDYAGGDASIDAHYLRIGGGPGYGNGYLRFDYEQLASNDGRYAFQTPLGTNHLFQGWADLFLTTPREGIEDYFVSAGYKLGPAQLLLEYHDLNSDFHDIDYGEEWDVSVAYAFLPRLTGKFEFASFNEGDRLLGPARKPDTTKLWLTLIFNY